MNEELAKAAAQFLLRVQLYGNEVPAFNAVMMALEQVKDHQPSETEGSATEAATIKSA